MHLFTKRLSLISAVLFLAISCRKGDMPEPHYFGKVNIGLLSLPGTPNVIMYFNNKKLDTVFISSSNIENGKFVIEAGQEGKLAAYDATNNQLIADTLITVQPNGVQSFRLAYSKDFGFNGFVGSGNATLPADSVFVQVVNKLNPTFYPKNKYHLAFFYVDPNLGELVQSPVSLKNWERGKLSSQVLKFKIQDENAQGYTYITRLIDTETGEVVLQPDGRRSFSMGVDQSIASKSVIVVVTDDESGSISSNLIEL